MNPLRQVLRVWRWFVSIERSQSIAALVSIGSLLFAIGHLAFPDASIDSTTVALLVIAVVPWLGAIFTSLELPGGVKIQYRELERVTKEAEDAGLLAVPSAAAAPAYTSVAQVDPNLALVGLRIEIERRLRELGEIHGIVPVRGSVRRLLDELRNANVLSPEEYSVLADLIGLGNSAAHGAEVAVGAVDWATDVGPRLLAALDQRINRQ